MQSGVTLAFSSDWPCTWPPDPMVGIQQVVRRTVWHASATTTVGGIFDGGGQGGAVPSPLAYEPDESITVEQAVDAYTRGSAYARFSDDQLGTLENGKLADLAVLSQDIFSVPTEDIAKTRVLMTMVGGKVVYKSKEKTVLATTQ